MMAEEVTLYQCLQAHLTTDPISLVEGSGQFCTTSSPAELPVTSLKVHYFLHYLQRGHLDRLIPVPHMQDEREEHVEHYLCNICRKRFNNVPAKKDFSGHRSVMLHLAIEHGKIVDLMRSDAEVDMEPAIEALQESDPKIKTFLTKGTSTTHDTHPVSKEYTLEWKLANGFSDAPYPGQNFAHNDDSMQVLELNVDDPRLTQLLGQQGGQPQATAVESQGQGQVEGQETTTQTLIVDEKGNILYGATIVDNGSGGQTLVTSNPAAEEALASQFQILVDPPHQGQVIAQGQAPGETVENGVASKGASEGQNLGEIVDLDHDEDEYPEPVQGHFQDTIKEEVMEPDDLEFEPPSAEKKQEKVEVQEAKEQIGAKENDPEEEEVTLPEFYACPKCPELKYNRDRDALKLHAYIHYKVVWEVEINKIAKPSDKMITCIKCERKRKVSGATPTGARNAMMCHWAVFHKELKNVMNEDPDVDPEFVKALYSEKKEPRWKTARDLYQKLDLFVKGDLPAGRQPGRPRGMTYEIKKRAKEEREKVKKEKKTKGQNGSTKDEVSPENDKEPKITQNPYIKKRKKIDFTLDSEDEEDEWGDKKVKVTVDEGSESPTRRILPRRAASAKAEVKDVPNSTLEDITEEFLG